MLKKKLIAAVACTLSLTMLLSACGTTAKSGSSKTSLVGRQFIKASNQNGVPAEAKNRKDTLVIGQDATTGNFNPLYADWQYDMNVSNMIFDSLADLDDEGQPIPGMASWTVSKDGLTYTFKLKDGIKFSDGSDVTADDVAFTDYVIADPAYDGPQDISSVGIKGFKDYNKGNATTIEGIKVVDKHTISFTLDAPNSAAIYGLAGVVVPKAVFGKGYSKGHVDGIKAVQSDPTKLVGSGQYKLVSYKDGQDAVLVANDSYWKGKPSIKNLIFKTTSEDTNIQSIEKGDTDVEVSATCNAQNVEELQSKGFLNIELNPTAGYGFIGMNCKDPKYQDAKVRQALTIGLNRKQIVQTVYKQYAKVVNEPDMPGNWTYNNDVNKNEFNTEKANKLLDEAGWKKGSDGIREKDGKKFVITYTASMPNSVNEAVIPVATENYKALGITFKADQVDSQTMNKKFENKDFDMIFLAWGINANPDSSIFKSTGLQNYTNFADPKIDDLMTKALAEQDKEKRAKIYQDVNKQLNEDCPYIFLYQRNDMVISNTRISGIKSTSFRSFMGDIWKAKLK